MPQTVQTTFKILVVDDDLDILETLIDFLALGGHNLFKASQGQQALSILDREKGFDLVISDYHMPIMNGAALHFAMRERGIDCPFILCTGSPELIPADVWPALNLYALIAKPYSPSVIEQHIADLIAQKAERASLV